MAKTTDFTNFANERPNYFAGQYLLEDDFNLQHKYLSDRQRYYTQSLHISGIIEGLEVVVVQNSKSVQVQSGAAIDSNGNLIILKETITFSDFPNITVGQLYIQYAQTKQNQQQPDVVDSYTRWKEKPIVGFAAQTPANSVKLAKLTINQNNITLDVNLREYSGLSLPNSNSKALTLRSGGNANPNLAVLTGSLKIEGDLTVAGTISGTIDTKNITSGTLSVDRIPSLSADKITSGTLSVDRIPSLSADKITSGTLSVDRIPNLSANKITSGTISGSLTVNGTVQIGGFTDADQDEWPKVTWYRDLNKKWDEGLIKHGSKKGVFKKEGYGVHFHEDREFGLWSSDWTALFAVEGKTGNTSIKGNLTVNGAITPSVGNTENNGIMFPKNPYNVGIEDAAWIRYYSGNPHSPKPGDKEQMTLVISILNDADDRLLLKGGNIELEAGNIKLKSVNIEASSTIKVSSSRQLKENIIELSGEEALETLKNLNPVKYDYKTRKTFRKNIGFIAEEMPDNLAGEDRKTISPMEIVPVLTKIIQSQQMSIKSMQEKLELLTNQ